MIYFVIGIIGLLIVITLIVIFNIRKTKEIKDIINMCESNIGELLSEKKERIFNLLPLLDDKNLELDTDIIGLNIYEADSKLYKAFNKAQDIGEALIENKPRRKKKNIELALLLKEAHILNEAIVGLKGYFGEKVKDYNAKLDNKLFGFIYGKIGYEKIKEFPKRKGQTLEILKD